MLPSKYSAVGALRGCQIEADGNRGFVQGLLNEIILKEIIQNSTHIGF